MTIKSDKWIREMAEKYGMIEPFIDRNVGKGEAVSYGLSSYGYDLRVSDEYKIFHNALNSVIDPKKIDFNSFVDYQGDVCIIPPQFLCLGPVGGIFSDSGKCAGNLCREIDLCPLRYYYQCYSA